ncbi:MAG TPA: PIG-L deacetylase family protein [Burkholderiales bacterium]|jgi:4-oxalomesaconate hydratase|nr:PIG-L deacetylase family protein [Burkholderiales bacterium]
MKQKRKLLVIGAHSADFVWRCSGAVAVFTRGGGEAQVIALSYGERGESGELWKQKDQTVENVKKIRHAEAAQAADIIGASFTAMDLGDYPLEVGADATAMLTETIRDYAPDVIITHADRDPFNPDHGVASAAAQRARMLATASNVASAFKIIRPPQLFLFEPHQTELCGYVPTTFVDITDVFDLKLRAMEAMKAQSYLKQHYAEHAEHRANHARRISGNKSIRYAESFQRVFPQIVESL